MNKHKKLAIFIAPILIIIGYIASDYYIEYQAEEQKLFRLTVDGSCDILNGECILKAGDFKLNIFDKAGMTSVNSTFPLDSVTIFLVDEKNIANAFPLTKVSNAYYWHNQTPLRNSSSASNRKQKLRIIAKVKGGQYISEFYSQAAN